MQMQIRDHMSPWGDLDHLEKELACASILLLGLTSVREGMGKELIRGAPIWPMYRHELRLKGRRDGSISEAEVAYLSSCLSFLSL